jgi:hypothetical protein
MFVTMVYFDDNVAARISSHLTETSLLRARYRKYFVRLRSDFPTLRIAIIHVTAPREAIFQRAAVRLERGKLLAFLF